MTHVKDFISHNPNDWLQLLEDKFKIHVTRDGDLVSLKYNQIESPMAHPVVRQCRGMVVHAPTGRILAHPYDKFWNHGEELAAPIDWSTARVMDKLDGSLMILYWNPFDDRGYGRWCVASSGHPTAGGTYGVGGTKTFAEAFWEVFNSTGMGLPWSKEACYMFELVAPDNRIVCKYDAAKLILHGSRWVVDDPACETGVLVLRDIARRRNWPIVDVHPVASLDEAIAKASELDPLQSEGFVVVDANFNRVKIKSPRYVRLHQLRDRTTPRAIIEAWQKGEEEEILSHFPEMAEDFDRVTAPLYRAATHAAGCVEVWGGLPSRKDFALQVKDLPYQAVCFKLYCREAPTIDNALRIMRAMPVAALERIVEGMAPATTASGTRAAGPSPAPSRPGARAGRRGTSSGTCEWRRGRS